MLPGDVCVGTRVTRKFSQGSIGWLDPLECWTPASATLAEVVMSLGGRAGEILATGGQSFTEGAVGDLSRARQLIAEMRVALVAVTFPGIQETAIRWSRDSDEQLLIAAAEYAESLIRRNEDAVIALAQQIASKGASGISGQALLDLMEAHLGPKPMPNTTGWPMNLAANIGPQWAFDPAHPENNS